MSKRNGKITKEAQGESKAFETDSKGRRLYDIGGEKFSFGISEYASDPMVMGISMYDADEEPYSTLSVNFGSFLGDPYTGSFIRDNCTFIDTNNNPDAEHFLKEMGAKPYTKWGSEVKMQSGFCEYPLYEFPNDLLKEMDPKGFEAHEKIYWKNLEIEQKKLNEASMSEFKDFLGERDIPILPTEHITVTEDEFE